MLAAFAIGLPVIVVIAMEANAAIWPNAPILIGSWVVFMLVVRSVGQHKIYMSTLRKQREIARREIGRLEARIEEAQGKSGDKN
jgi:hypothetical protein